MDERMTARHIGRLGPFWRGLGHPAGARSQGAVGVGSLPAQLNAKLNTQSDSPPGGAAASPRLEPRHLPEQDAADVGIDAGDAALTRLESLRHRPRRAGA